MRAQSTTEAVACSVARGLPRIAGTRHAACPRKTVMSSDLTVHASIDTPALAHGPRCRCALHGRRVFTGGLLAAAALPGTALAQIPECKRSVLTKVVSAQQLEQAAGEQYRQMLQQAS